MMKKIREVLRLFKEQKYKINHNKKGRKVRNK